MQFNLLSFADTIKSVGGVLLAVVILLAMVTIHEFGHYVAGKILGFKINEFAVGFGPAILKKRSKKTGELFALRVIPLGGYCAFDGEDEFEEETEEPFQEMAAETKKEENDGGRDALKEEYPEPKGERFNDQAPWKRIIVLIAGATMNYLLALVLLLIMVGSYGVPMCIAMPTGYTSDMTVPYAEWETPTLEGRDVLLELNGEKISIITDCIKALEGKKAGEEVSATVLRYKDEEGWTEKTVTLTLLADGEFENMADIEQISASMGLEVFTTTMRRGFWATVGGAFSYSFKMAGSVLQSLGELLTGKLGIDSMGGPITTITTTAQVASTSWYSFLYIASFIGVNLAVFNLLPVPALDGCKVIFCLIEWIRKKPVNRKVETLIHFIGIIFLFGFAILVDLLQLF